MSKVPAKVKKDVCEVVGAGVTSAAKRPTWVTLQVQQTLTSMTVPLSQVTQDLVLDWEEPYTARWERRRTVTVQAMPNGTTYPDLKSTVFEKLQAIELPPGYDITSPKIRVLMRTVCEYQSAFLVSCQAANDSIQGARKALYV